MPAVVHTGTFTVAFKNDYTIHENEVRCMVKDSDYNLSYNPTLVNGNYSSGSLKDFATGSSFYTYATQIGLYDDDTKASFLDLYTKVDAGANTEVILASTISAKESPDEEQEEDDPF